MRLTIREQPIIKSTVYSLVCLILLLFSYSFLPATRMTDCSPGLLVAAISSLALFEGIKYASFFALFFSVLETLMLGTNTLIFPLFYVVFAMLCTWLFESVFVRNFFSWLCYTVGGVILYLFLSALAPMSDWDVFASDVLFVQAIETFIMSTCLSLPIYPIFKFIKRKTDKNKNF